MTRDWKIGLFVELDLCSSIKTNNNKPRENNERSTKKCIKDMRSTSGRKMDQKNIRLYAGEIAGQ
jgi:hypothetical protein